MVTRRLAGGSDRLTVDAPAGDVSVTDRKTGQIMHGSRYVVERLKARTHIRKARGFWGHGSARWEVTVTPPEDE
jgi:hypothetical protein